MPRTVAVAVPLILFLATLIRSTFGFGEALVGVPLLALVNLAFSAYSLRRGTPRALPDDRHAGLFGFASGVPAARTG